MPVYEFKGFNAKGKIISGVRDAENSRNLQTMLRREGIFLKDYSVSSRGPIQGKGKGKGKGKGSRGAKSKLSMEIDLSKYFSRIKVQDIAVLTRQLCTLLNAGIPLVESLTAISEQQENERLKVILAEIKEKVNEGSSLAEALKRYPKVFSALYINMVHAGESSGALEIVLGRLADFTESQAQLRQKIMGTMMYPIIMILMSCALLALLFSVVIPKVTQIFEDMKASLPISTKALILFSDIMSNYWYVLLIVIGGGTFLFFRYINSEKGKLVWDRVVLKIPLFGSLVRMISISRFTKTLGTLLNSGVPLLGAIDIVKNIVSNSVIAKVLEKARDSIKEGESIADPLKRSGEFPPIVIHMISIGEKSGQLEDMLLKVSESYENQIEVRLNALTTLLEPLMIVVMGSMVAFIAFSILLPILQMNELINK